MRNSSSSLNIFQAFCYMSSDRYFTTSTSRKHVTKVAEGRYRLQLIRFYLDCTLWSAVNGAGISYALCTPINQDLVSVFVACSISNAPKVCSHCSRCCCCLLLYNRQKGVGRGSESPTLDPPLNFLETYCR